jgi:hypothetical protein
VINHLHLLLVKHQLWLQVLNSQLQVQAYSLIFLFPILELADLVLFFNNLLILLLGGFKKLMNVLLQHLYGLILAFRLDFVQWLIGNLAVFKFTLEIINANILVKLLVIELLVFLLELPVFSKVGI